MRPLRLTKAMFSSEPAAWSTTAAAVYQSASCVRGIFGHFSISARCV